MSYACQIEDDTYRNTNARDVYNTMWCDHPSRPDHPPAVEFEGPTVRFTLSPEDHPKEKGGGWPRPATPPPPYAPARRSRFRRFVAALRRLCCCCCRRGRAAVVKPVG